VLTEALERQRQMYERQMQLLRSQLMSPSTPSLPYSFEAFSKMTPTGTAPSTFHPRYQQWAHDRFTGLICLTQTLTLTLTIALVLALTLLPVIRCWQKIFPKLANQKKMLCKEKIEKECVSPVVV